MCVFRNTRRSGIPDYEACKTDRGWLLDFFVETPSLAGAHHQS